LEPLDLGAVFVTLLGAMKTKTKSTSASPLWGDAKAVNARFGLGRSVLYRLVSEGKIRSSSLRERGKIRGKRLFSFPSIEAFIESRASGGVLTHDGGLQGDDQPQQGPNNPSPKTGR
jgi:hypothetical protein